MRNVSVADPAQTVRVRVWISLSGIALAVAFALGVGLLRGQLGDIRYFLIFLLGLLSTVFAWCAAILSGSHHGGVSRRLRWARPSSASSLPIIVVSIGR